MRIHELHAKSVVYFSIDNKEIYFAWLQKLKCVKDYYGIYLTLYIPVDFDEMTDEELHELCALFLRYGVDQDILMTDLPADLKEKMSSKFLYVKSNPYLGN
jgi:hypothetical protein